MMHGGSQTPQETQHPKQNTLTQTTSRAPNRGTPSVANELSVCKHKQKVLRVSPLQPQHDHNTHAHLRPWPFFHVLFLCVPKTSHEPLSFSLFSPLCKTEESLRCTHTHTGNRHNKQPFYFSSWLFPFLLGAFPSWAVFVCSLPLLTRTTTGRKSAVTHRKPSPPLLLLLPFHFSAISLSDSHIHTSFSSPILWGLPVCSSLQCTYSSVSSSPLLFLSFCVCLSSASFEIMWSLWRN